MQIISMKLKIYSLFVFFAAVALNVSAQNALSIQATEVQTNADFDLNISMQNQENIAALQFDINYDSTAFALLNGHVLTAAAPNHTLSVSTPSPGVARIIVFSPSKAVFASGSGLLLRLKMRSKTLPGNLNFSFSNIIPSSDTGMTIAMGGTNLDIVVKGAILKLLSTGIDFGRVPIGNNVSQQLQVQNTGNIPLMLIGNNSVSPFSVLDAYPITVNPNEVKNITVGLNTATKANTSANLSFQNNDPDPIRKIQAVTLKTDVYAVNEIHLGSGSGTINSEIEIPVNVNNMESFNGFQFDVLLPTDVSYVENSIIPSQRFNGQTINASVVNGNTIRFVAFSATNTDFKGIDGELFRFKLKPAVSSGTYGLAISNPILANATLGNIQSDSYSGYLQINSPNLTLDTDVISYGAIPITQSKTSTINLTNTGSALLIIDSIVSSSNQIGINASLPIELLPGENKTVTLTYNPASNGDFFGTVSLRHNGPDLQKIINVYSTVFSPNYVMVDSESGVKNQLNNLSILLKNNDAVRAVQFDVELPTGFDLQTANIATTARTAGFNVTTSLLSSNKYRVLLYSFSNVSLNAGSESILNFPVFINSNVNLGAYPFTFSNVTISDTSNKNISSIALEEGRITIGVPPIATADQILVVKGGTVTTLVGGADTVLANDIDSESNPLTAILTSGVSNGTLTLNNDGTFSYTHDASETMTDSFSYKAHDGILDSNIVTVTITVGNKPVISYNSPQSYTEGITIMSLEPTNTGGIVTSYSIAPSLPTGLVFNETTGTISGTPTVASVQTNYTVTATNSYGSETATIAIKVNSAGTKPSISYTTPQTFVIGGAIVAISPTNTGSPATSYDVVPSLPTGLVLNNTTGIISGTPTIASVQTDYTITATNSYGSGTASIVITVNSAGTKPSISYETPQTFVVGGAIVAISPTNTGSQATSYAVAPSLPTGLVLNNTTGIISGTPTIASVQTDYTITATNSYGSGTASIVIMVNSAGTKPSISYETPQTFVVGGAIVAITPTNMGSQATSYAVAPSLPTGLVLNTSTGIISGTPTIASVQTDYTITATNSYGTGTATIAITVNSGGTKPSISYETPQTFVVGGAIVAITPTNTGSPATSYAIAPSLPTGLVFNETTGTISGTPTVASTETSYMVTATNLFGSGAATIIITVNSNLDIEDVVFKNMILYPNPTTGEVNIDNVLVQKVNVYNNAGQLIKTITNNESANTTSVSLNNVPAGVYYLKIETENANTVKQVIKQ
ncbi:putative Ig domain-containing protein [Flavobacterium granuli]|uniref:VCBS repeat-containing protein n=1 Tax=Flavobacterium granuli TaxID=280093 RepID=A0ABU1S0K6_9FLAO|nr:putative Ig domain-containing protein [Flavobacterium granuli]MDR6844561.1 VCBS repeat-containing protein [Flavobacterium granuli]